MGWAVLVPTAVAIAAFVSLHLLPTGLATWRDPVSRYGTTRFALVYNVASASIGVAGLAAAAAAWALPNPAAAIVITVLVVFAVTRLMISWFPMDAPGSPPTTRGRWHLRLAAVAVMTAVIAALGLPAVISDAPSVDRALVLLARLLFAALIIVLITARSGWSGLTERLFYAAVFAWLIGVGLAFIGALST
jgi:hypothetical protein